MEEKKTNYYWGLTIIAVLGIGIGLLARAYHLSLPTKQVFDEVYFPSFANKLLHGELVFDVHPPLGKFIIALGIWLFGDNTFGWRIMPLIFGLFNIGLFGALTWWVGNAEDPKLPGWTRWLLGGLIIAMEPFFILYSRVGLMDGILFFAIMVCLLLAYRAKKPLDILGLAVVIGLACAIKWLALGIVLPVGYILWRKKLLGFYLWSSEISVLVYLLVVYLAQVVGHAPHSLAPIIEWHNQVWNYHVHLKDTHPWGSPWWSWPIMKRPLLMYYEVGSDNKVQMMTAIGNPLLWYSSGLAVLGSMGYLVWLWIKDKSKLLDHPLVPLLLGFFALWLPWAKVTRVLFIYHYMPSYGFALLILLYWLMAWWRKWPQSILLFLGVSLLLSIFFMPIVMGIPVSAAFINAHVWFKGWL